MSLLNSNEIWVSYNDDRYILVVVSSAKIKNASQAGDEDWGVQNFTDLRNLTGHKWLKLLKIIF